MQHTFGLVIRHVPELLIECIINSQNPYNNKCKGLIRMYYVYT